ncbi:hypothetical protein ACLOJK_039794 [Asimina triloba]
MSIGRMGVCSFKASPKPGGQLKRAAKQRTVKIRKRVTQFHGRERHGQPQSGVSLSNSLKE